MSTDLTKLVNDYKYGHTISLDGHSIEPKTMVHARSSTLLGVKSPSYPAFTCDSSLELAQEDQIRKSTHKRIMQSRPEAFHRRTGEHFPSSMIVSNQIVKDLLCDMHKDKDVNDIDKQRTGKYTFSIRSAKDLQDRTALEDLMFNNLHPLEDFVRPESPVTPRTTGYEHGHIRSLMKLDTYGPTSSKLTSNDRQFGTLPSPNVDRYVRVSPTHKLTLRSDIGSASSSRASTSQSTASGLSSHGDARRNEKVVNSESMRHLFHSSSNVNFDSPSALPALDVTIPTSLRQSTGGSIPKRITDKERQLLDPLVRRKTWHKSYVERIKATQHEHELHKQRDRIDQQQRKLAYEEKKKIRAFEKHLTLAKFE